MNKKWRFAESIIFLLFALANAYPVFVYHFFPTLDGAPHLYNAHCIKEMLLGNDFLHSFMLWNPFPMPNWTGHFIMSLANMVVPAWLAEKVFLLFYLIALPYGFRYLLKTLSPKNYLVSYLIFPFCYTYMFFLGFYNFSVSIVFLFFTLGFWLRHKDKLTIPKTLVMLLLVTATYFSHVSVYGILFPMLFGLLFIDEASRFFSKKIRFKEFLTAMAIKTGVLIISFGITAWWTIEFLSPRPASIHTYLPRTEMFQNIKIIQPIIGFVQSEEIAFTPKIFYVLVILTLVVLINRIIHFIKGFGSSGKIVQEKLKTLFNKGDLWLVFAGVFLLGYYILPDSDNWAGYFSLRILLLFFLMFLVWLGTQKIQKFILIPAMVVALFFYIKVSVFRDTITGSLNQTALQCYKAGAYVRPNTTVFTLNLSGNWLYGHFDKYLGIDKPMVILDNNECHQGYFPLIWNTKNMPGMFLDASGALDSCYISPLRGNNGPRKVDYIFIMGRPDTNKLCEKKLFRFTKNNCKTAYSDGFVSLFEIK